MRISRAPSVFPCRYTIKAVPALPDHKAAVPDASICLENHVKSGAGEAPTSQTINQSEIVSALLLYPGKLEVSAARRRDSAGEI
jgi:hypothetical protein